MTGQQLLQEMNTAFAGVIQSVDHVSKDRLGLTITAAGLVAAADYLFNQTGGRLITSVGIDKRPVTGKFEVAYLFAFAAGGLILSIKVEVDPEHPSIPSITPIIEGANWCEREVRDLIGVAPENHPDPRRLILADDWPEGQYPLRKDFPYNYRPPRASVLPDMKQPGEKTTVVAVGPFFPSLEEPAYFRLFVEGEAVIGCDYRGFYSHRGIEKLADTVLDYNRVPFMAERICGICGFTHSTCYCQSVEEAGDIEVPRRARYIRTIMLELERIHSHLLWLGLAGHNVGFDTVLMQAWRIREPVMWLCEQISGNRKTYGMNLVGGVRRDIPAAMHAKILETLAGIEKDSRAVVDAIIKDAAFLSRLRHVGVLTKEDARKICVVGPTARASGIRMDSRVDRPYAAYDELTVNVSVREDGDVLARALVRIDELFDAIAIIRQALKNMPEGELMAEVSNIPPWREGISVTEAPRGECCHYVLTSPDNRPYRWRVRASTYPQLQAVPLMLKDATVADFPLIVASIDPCFSCTERVETVDTRNHAVRVYHQDELLAAARKKYRGGGPACE